RVTERVLGVGLGRDAARGEQAGQARRDASAGGGGNVGEGRSGLGEDPAETRFDHDVRMPRDASPGLNRPGAPPSQEAVRRTRGVRAVVRRPRRRSSQRCQSTSNGEATKIEEYVPEMI